MRRFLILFFLAAVLGAGIYFGLKQHFSAKGVRLLAADDDVPYYETILQEADIATDSASLIAYLDEHSLSDRELQNPEQLIRSLGSDKFEEREEASRKLVLFRERIRPSLQQALKDSDPEIRNRAKKCLQQIDYSYNAELFVGVAWLLHHRQVQEGVAALLRYVPSATDEDEIQEIWDALYALTVREGTIHPEVVSALTDALPARRAVAAYILSRAGNMEQRALSRKVLQDPEFLVRSYLLTNGRVRGRRFILSSHGEAGELRKAEIERAIAALRTDEVLRRQGAIDTLVKVGPAGLHELRQALQDSDPRVRAAVALVLGSYRHHAKTAIPDLIRMSKDKEPCVRASIATALGTIGVLDDDILPALSTLLQDSSPDVRYAAANALTRVGPHGSQALQPLLKAMKDDDFRVRLFVAYALGNLSSHSEVTLPVLVNTLTLDKDLSVRGAAAYSLGQLRSHGQDAVPALIQALKEPPGALPEAQVELHRRVVYALGLIRPQSQLAVRQLEAVLARPSSDSLMRRAAAEALGNIGSAAAEAVPALRTRLFDEDREVREEAERAIEKILAKTKKRW